MESLISGESTHANYGSSTTLKLIIIFEDFNQLNIYIQNLELCFEHSKTVSVKIGHLTALAEPRRNSQILVISEILQNFLIIFFSVKMTLTDEL